MLGVGVAEVGCQPGQQGLGVTVGAVAAQQTGGREAVSQVVNPRAACRGPRGQPGLPGQAVESPPDPGVLQAGVGAGDEQGTVARCGRIWSRACR